MGLVHNYRRYLHRERMNARAVGDGELEGAWRAKQEAQPGTLLPATFPFLRVLERAGYTTREDLEGADVFELVRIAELSTRDAVTVVAAYAALPPLS